MRVARAGHDRETRARAGQARAAFAAFVTLFFVMCGHSILEMAPDALFLRSLPVAQLHWVLIIATLTVFGTTFLRPVAFPASTPE
mgnify:FL=1